MNYTQIQKAEEQLKSWAQSPSPTEMKKIQHTREMIESSLKRNFPIEEIKRNAYALDTHGSVIYCFPCGNCLSKEHGRLSEDVSNSRIVL